MQNFKKSLGQNFLIDKNIAKKITKLIGNYKNKNIIEIGPGKGALTDFIIKSKPKKLILIEKDKYLFDKLIEQYSSFKFIEIHNMDALNFNFKKIKKPKSIIGNLPYNISIKLIIMWFKEIIDYNEIIIMIQKEVAQKMKYKNYKKMNRLNFLTGLFANFDIKFNVSKNVFFPKPKILSSVIKITPKKNYIEKEFEKIENFTRIIFHNKRKKLRNVIPKENKFFLEKNLNNKKIFELLNYRAEDLSIEKLMFLFKAF